MTEEIPQPAPSRPVGHRRAEKPAKPGRRRRLVVAGLVSVVALALIGAGGWQLWLRHDATSGTARPDAAARDGRYPDERKVPLSSCRAETPKHPRTISLGSLEVTGCVEPVGVQNGRMEAPGNIHVAGWFDRSALPGSEGLTVIDGHSSGRFKDGIFNKLGELERGSILTITLGNGTVERYAVTSVKQHAESRTMPALYSDAEDQDATLALYTCSGDYDAATHTYADRTVVLAVPATD
ncbi:MAG: class F sortase [Aeromicrobium erythreum]